MKIPKPAEADEQYFRSIVPDHPDVEVKPMFGNLAAFVQGNMFMGLFGSDVGVRLGPDDRDTLKAVDGAGAFGPEGRPMKEYVALPTSWRSDGEAAAEWVARALAHTSRLPPK